jgi:hypothetical protein
VACLHTSIIEGVRESDARTTCLCVITWCMRGQVDPMASRRFSRAAGCSLLPRELFVHQLQRRFHVSKDLFSEVDG